MEAKINFLEGSHLATFVKFCSVGGATALIYFSVMYIAESVFFIQYLASVSIAYFISTIFHFLMNRKYTFLATHDSHRQQFARYSVMLVLNYLVTIAVVKISVEVFQLSPYLGVCISVAFTAVFGYVMGRFWVFKDNR